MYQYKAKLISTGEVIAEGHSVEEIEHHVLHFRRQQKKGEHTHGNDSIEVIHVQRDQLKGEAGAKEIVLKKI